MIILVCGGRDYSDAATLRRILDSYRNIYGLIHGDARGADRLAKEWMRRRIAIDCEQCLMNRKVDPTGALGFRRHSDLWMAGYPADWKTHGKAAGPIRNQEMLDLNPGIELVIAFPGGTGTADMVRRARAKGITVEEIRE